MAVIHTQLLFQEERRERVLLHTFSPRNWLPHSYPMNPTDFELLSQSPGLQQLFDLAWRLFKVNLALVSPSGDRAVCYDSTKRSAPFCQALQRQSAGRRLCLECDRRFFQQALHEPKALRYRCHAGLTEFIVPVIRRARVVALLQCGQVLDAKPSEDTWQSTCEMEARQGIQASQWKSLYYNGRVLPPPRQSDLLLYMNLVAGYLASADCPLVCGGTSRIQETIGQVVTYIETHLTEPLSVSQIARSARVSSRTLARWFPQETGLSVLEYLLKRRIALACHYLQTTDQTCLEIAFASGFQSIQNFNRTFRRLKGVSPKAWRLSLAQARNHSFPAHLFEQIQPSTVHP